MFTSVLNVVDNDLLMASTLTQAITGPAWAAYRHRGNCSTLQTQLVNGDITVDSPLMRLDLPP